MYPNFEFDKKLVKIHPSPRQLAVEQMEFYAFVHFTVNTFTDREWGEGTEEESLFDPTEFDADQWADALVSAGMKGLILTCKHHDGFCLWPSAMTSHCVKNSPWKNGNGDIVREVSDACRSHGLKFGVYLSPWDRNQPLYGQGKPYDDYFCAQLTELLTGYGEIFSVWFDGACGEGPNGKKQVYDWDRYYALIRELQPGAAISVCGPDIRWCGNEAGYTRPSEWSVLPTGFGEAPEVAEKSQKEDSAAFRKRQLSASEEDLGSRDLLRDATGFKWSPCETNTSIRPGWFYHASDDDKVRSVDNLVELWFRSVGGNSTLLLNIPPDRRGLFHENDVAALEAMGRTLRELFAVNLAADASIEAPDDGYHTAEVLKTDSYDEYYKPFDGENAPEIVLTLPEARAVSILSLKEHIPMGQRIERFAVDVQTAEDGGASDGRWKQVAEGTTVGYRKILRFDPVTTDAVRIRILDSRVCPVLSFVGLY
ncbi:MAG: alpha-fucosidase [Ruminococcaceae bacterium]|jgi:alpha-L-fucosidase|nr:alpha-fucosidase [Oscillospiraceae bacterium]